LSALRDWAKLDTRWYEEPDLLAATDAAPEAFAMWPVLIAKAKAESSASRNPDGTVRIAPRSLAFDAQCAQDRIGAALDAMAAEGLIRYTAEGTKELLITLNGFAKWQSPKGSNADRQARKREKNVPISGENNAGDTARHSATQNDPQDVDVDVDKKEPLSSKDDDVANVFEYWCKVERETGGLGAPPNGRRPKLTKDRAAKIRARLSEGYSREDLKMAIAFYARDPHHSGDNDRSTRFTDLTTTLKNGSKVEAGIAGYESRGASSAGVDAATVALLAKYQPAVDGAA
jgi:hypothetical protein